MIQNIILAATLIVAFFMSVSAYTLGLKHGKQLSSNSIPNVTLNPVKKVVQAVEQHKAKQEEKEVVDELNEIMSATKESMIQAIKSEVK